MRWVPRPEPGLLSVVEEVENPLLPWWNHYHQERCAGWYKGTFSGMKGWGVLPKLVAFENLFEKVEFSRSELEMFCIEIDRPEAASEARRGAALPIRLKMKLPSKICQQGISWQLPLISECGKFENLRVTFAGHGLCSAGRRCSSCPRIGLLEPLALWLLVMIPTLSAILKDWRRAILHNREPFGHIFIHKICIVVVQELGCLSPWPCCWWSPHYLKF